MKKREIITSIKLIVTTKQPTDKISKNLFYQDALYINEKSVTTIESAYTLNELKELHYELESLFEGVAK